MPIDRATTLETLQRLVRIDSRNPGLEDGAPGELEIARFVAARLRALGWPAELQELGAGRASVLARRAGSGGGRSLMINVHLDTVGVAGMAEPFGGALRDGRVHGRGAQDIKGGVAAALALAQVLAEERTTLAGDVVLAFVADEEHESIGTERLVRDGVLTDAAIVLEPSELDVCVAHRGFGVFRVRTEGRTAHGGRADLGRDANTHMAHVLLALEALAARWRRELPDPQLGAPTLHVPLLAGGRQLFTYAGACEAHVECRTVPGQTADGVLGELRAALASLAGRVPDLRASVQPVQWRAPYRIAPDAELVTRVLAATAAVRGRPSALVAHGWWEDSALLGEAGVPTVVLGPVGSGLHTEEEWVDADSVVQLAGILHRAALDWCGAG